mmetsp:Transcript_21288/g.29824  ORF Transcript_21288/g.29824 Transcript_21288/m.29824 type:complete len:492 (+) Transcript_21288:233-1708(+)|eukprot:CAMPEP_0185275070 /NCGR_PEP_ID=MMETSP1359-20130426/53228_1 /TAXON_ID=552665 /ORGANISM="Bigelowiella longifila, Strain CCMP242" /LENGTH=491 /DNA_ID=CAMNT_0027868279 /DNA_START=222 /DNA_END=1697 /DNA_ORIENTATION=-
MPELKKKMATTSDSHELKKVAAPKTHNYESMAKIVEQESKGMPDLTETTETKTMARCSSCWCWTQMLSIVTIFWSNSVLNVIHLNLRVISAALGSICAISSDPEFLGCSALFMTACVAAIFFKGIVAAVAPGIVILLTALRTLWNYLPNKDKDSNSTKEKKETIGGENLPIVDRSALRIQDILVNIMSYQSLCDRARLRVVSKSTTKAYCHPSLWMNTLVPDSCTSINLAVKAIPKSLSSLYPRFIPKIKVRMDMTYYEGDPRGLSVLFKRRPSGIYVDKPLIIEGYHNNEDKKTYGKDEEVPREMKEDGTPPKSSSSTTATKSWYARIHSNAGEAITVSKNASGVQLIGLDVYINRFSSHGIAVYADNVQIKNCRISAQGTNACGILVAGRSVSRLRSCEISGCGGSGVLLAYNAGVHVVNCLIKNNQWSGIGAFAGSSLSIQNTSIENNALFAVGAAVDVTCNLFPGNTFQGNGRGDSVHRYLAYEPSS